MSAPVLVSVRCWCGRRAAVVRKSDEGPRLESDGLYLGSLRERSPRDSDPLLSDLTSIFRITCPLTGTADEHRPLWFYFSRGELIDLYSEARTSEPITVIAEKPSLEDELTGNPEGPYIRRT